MESSNIQYPVSKIQAFNWMIAGRAGEGVMTTGETFAKACHRHGLFVFNYYEFPSLIKGGHQTSQVFASDLAAYCQKQQLDFIIALDENGFKEHLHQITQDTIVISEPSTDKYDIEQYKHLTQHIYTFSMTNISREMTGHSIATNTVALGVSAYFLGLDPQIFKDLLREQFSYKGEEVVEGNIKVFEAGYEQAKALGPARPSVVKTEEKGYLLHGGEAVGSGAIAGGLEFYSAYPMSPSSNTFHYVAAQQDKYPLVVRHVEDEIAAINLAIGASYAGARAMTGSAGGGFALMVEALSLTGVMETPLVIMVAMRPGPATGLPTWTSQGDLQFVIRAGHGEFQKVVMAPGTVQEHFEMSRRAFDIAEKYQIPVIILTDKYILESYQTMPAPPKEYALEHLSMVKTEELPTDDTYRRYAITDSGISPRSIPGQAHGLQVTNSYEHDEFGYATEAADMTIKQVEKRARKEEMLKMELPQPELLGPAEADVTFVCWGSTVSVMKQLLHELISPPRERTSSEDMSVTNERRGTFPTVNVIYIPCLWPFPGEAFSTLASKAKKLVMIEGNFTGQAEQLIRQETGIQMHDHIRRYDGRPFYVEDIMEWIKK